MITFNQNITGIPHGYLNTGSICYFNVLLQALQGCSSLRIVMKYLSDRNKLKNNTVAKLLSLIWTDNVNLSNKIINDSGQQDSQEYFLLLLEKINIIEITNLFSFTIKKTILCNCKHKVEILETNTIFIIYNNLEQSVNKNLTLTDENYKCDNCKVKSKKLVETKLIKLPNILVISINKYNKKRNVEIPLKLNINCNNKIYKYIRVSHINHLPGHYVAVSVRKNNYYLFNDMQISEATEPNINTYVVFYHFVS